MAERELRLTKWIALLIIALSGSSSSPCRALHHHADPASNTSLCGPHNSPTLAGKELGLNDSADFRWTEAPPGIERELRSYDDSFFARKGQATMKTKYFALVVLSRLPSAA
jgi:hypothetical protein